MRKFTVLFLLVIFVVVGSGQVFAELSAKEILSKFAASQQQNTFVGKMEMSVHKPGKDARVYTFQIWVKGKDQALIRYLTPAREKGIGCLKLKNDMYMYLPSVEKTMRISGRQQLASSDFSSSDVLGIDMVADYEPTLETVEKIDKAEYYVLLLKAKSRDANYPLVKAWIRKGDFVPLKQEYYTSSGKLLRTLFYDEFQTVNGIMQAKKMTMTNTLAEGEYTVITILEGKFDQSIPDSIFTISNLEKGN